MMRKIGVKNAFPLSFQLTAGIPTSVMLVPFNQTNADPSQIKRNCGVFHSIVIYPGATEVRLAGEKCTRTVS
jgi:hypothetical protein